MSNLQPTQISTYSMEIDISEGLSLRSPSIELHAYSNGTIEMNVRCPFEYIGFDPNIQLAIRFSQESPPVFIENASTVIDVLYISDFNRRQYFVGSYRELPLMKSTNHATSVNFLVNLTNQLNNAYSFLLTQDSNITIDKIGYLGTLSLMYRLENAIIEAPNSQYVRIPFEFEGNIIGLELAFEIPENGNFIEKTWLEQDLSKTHSNRAHIYISLDVGEIAESELYVEWFVPRNLFWWELPPGSWLVSGLISFTAGVMSALFLEHRSKIAKRLSNIKNREKRNGEELVTKIRKWNLRNDKSSD
jgi:hypothetical protein